MRNHNPGFLYYFKRFLLFSTVIAVFLSFTAANLSGETDKKYKEYFSTHPVVTDLDSALLAMVTVLGENGQIKISQTETFAHTGSFADWEVSVVSDYTCGGGTIETSDHYGRVEFRQGDVYESVDTSGAIWTDVSSEVATMYSATIEMASVYIHVKVRPCDIDDKYMVYTIVKK